MTRLPASRLYARGRGPRSGGVRAAARIHAPTGRTPRPACVWRLPTWPARCTTSARAACGKRRCRTQEWCGGGQPFGHEPRPRARPAARSRSRRASPAHALRAWRAVSPVSRGGWCTGAIGSASSSRCWRRTGSTSRRRPRSRWNMRCRWSSRSPPASCSRRSRFTSPWPTTSGAC